MQFDAFLSFFRQVPILDVLFVGGLWVVMFCWWRHPRTASAEEGQTDIRQAAAAAITNQITGLLTAASIVLAGSGAVLAIGFGKAFPSPALDHLFWSAFEALFSIVIGLYTLGYIPSVIHRFDITRKPAVMIACFVQFILVVVSVARFFLALWQLSCHLRS
jgi:uncharacterized membrane protein